MLNFEFINPTRILFGEGQVERVGEQTARWGKKVLLVTGGKSVRTSGLYDQVLDQLRGAGLTVFELSGIEPNPRVTSVRRGVEICKSEQIDIILAVGGGSVIDAAKAMAAGAKYDGDVWDFYGKQVAVTDALPLGTILTLAATGTESNGNTVVTNWETHEKIGMGSPHLFPKFSILDPTLTFTVPRNQTAYGAIDAMAHVFEQYFHHTPSTPIQDRFSEGILRTIVENAPVALQNPEDYDARANLMWSATMALNMLIGQGVDEDWACHGIEHELSGFYDIPHGAGLAVVFPHWMRHVLPEGPTRFAQYAVRVWDEPDDGRSAQELALAGIRKTEEFFLSLGVPIKLDKWDIGEENLEEMALRAVRRGPLGSFKKLSSQDVLAILKDSLK